MRVQLPFTLLVAAVFACSIHAAPAQAQRVFVSATGSDGNPCTFASPCRSFQHAHDTVAANGEIDVLDPAGYGAVTITKSISIQGHGFSGITVASGGNGITINASSTDAVHLSGLLIEGGHVGQNGIVFNGGQSLTVENCVVRNMFNDGLDFVSSATATQKLVVSNSYFNDNRGEGVFVLPLSSGGINAAIDRTGFHRNNNGLHVDGTQGTGFLIVAVTDSVASNNSNIGVLVVSSSDKSPTNLSLTHSLVEGNPTGVCAQGNNATLWLAQSTVMGNNYSFNAASGGIINSFLDNYIAANNFFLGSLTSAGKQ
jgi:hypothetical protein